MKFGQDSEVAEEGTMTARTSLSAADLIAAERRRQVEQEGYSAEHDAGHGFALGEAAWCYWECTDQGSASPAPRSWPWAFRFWKPTNDPIRNLVKAGALARAGLDAGGPGTAHLEKWLTRIEDALNALLRA